MSLEITSAIQELRIENRAKTINIPVLSFDSTDQILQIGGGSVLIAPLGQTGFIDGSAAAPSISFQTDRSTGIWHPGTGVIDYSIAGVDTMRLGPSSIQLIAGASIGWSVNVIGNSSDVILLRDAAGVLSLRNGTTSQTFNVHNTFTNSSNFEKFQIAWDSSAVYLGMVAAGTGSQKAVRISTDANGANYWGFAATTPHLIPGTDNAFTLGGPANRVASVFIGTGKIPYYNNVATAGFGVPAVFGSARVTAQVAANASIATYTVGAADGSFLVSANVNVTTATTHNFGVVITYTDETSASRSLTLPMVQLAGTVVAAITNVTGVGPYAGIPVQIRCKAGTAITVTTSGTFTTVVYNAEGLITQIA